MPTASEIATKKFDKVIGGYRVEEVDNFLKQLSDDYSKLLQEKEDLEHKLEVLAEKLIEYREDEESLRTALLGAQKLGDSVIRESRTKAEIILRDATIKAERLVENAQKQIEHERLGLLTLQNEVAGFKNRLHSLYKQHLELISALPGEIKDNEAPIAEYPEEPSVDFDDKADDQILFGNDEENLVAVAGIDATDDADAELDIVYGVEDDKENDEELLPFEALPELMSASSNEDDDDSGESLDSVFADEVEKPKESRFGVLRFGDGFDLKRDNKEKKRR